jgi:hypothetical protein
MRTRQVSVFLENRPGRLREALTALESARVDIRTLSIAESVDFGVVRMILADTENGVRALRESGFTASVVDVLAVEVPHRPGGFLESVVVPLTEAGVNIEYAYAFAEGSAGRAVVVLKTSDLTKAESLIGG